MIVTHAVVVAGSTGAKVQALEAQVQALQQKCAYTAEALTNETKEAEKHRAYIAVLERTVKVRAEEVGLQGQGQMLTELARLRGELNACSRDLEAREDAAQAMEAELSSLRNEVRGDLLACSASVNERAQRSPWRGAAWGMCAARSTEGHQRAVARGAA